MKRNNCTARRSQDPLNASAALCALPPRDPLWSLMVGSLIRNTKRIALKPVSTVSSAKSLVEGEFR